MSSERIITAALASVLISLLLVGIVSGTLFQHVVQVVPVAVTIAAVVKRVDAACHAAMPIFVFWLGIMILIWLFLLGIANITTGHFTPAEIALTIVIGAASVVGIAAALSVPSTASPVKRAAWFVGFAVFQIAAMWLSLRPSIAGA